MASLVSNRNAWRLRCRPAPTCARQRPATGYTPLLVLAERCDLNDQPDAQVSIAEQLIAAGADLTGARSEQGQRT